IVVLDNSLNLLRFNEAAVKPLSLAQDDIVGQPISAILEGSDINEDTWEAIGKGLMEGKNFRMEIPVNAQTYQLEAAHIPDDGRWVLTLGDISDLAELNNLKTRMIRMASHDLKNPLGRVLGYGEMVLEMAEEDGLEPQYSNFVERMIKSANEMLSIISDILDLEHIRAGKLQYEPVDLLNITRDVIQRHSDDMSERSQTFRAHLPEKLPYFEGDYNQLVQSVSNVLGNASKYTPEGGEIDLTLEQRGDTVHLSVADTGYGMPKEAQEKLFTEFYRVRTERTREIKGTGLGLSLVKSVIEAHGGRIWVESELDKGSTFYIEIPLNREVATA
ncbi:MAG: HAMP domain-containing sensor histidine kinase, partial [Chloroflexota bacterium]